MGFLSTLGGIIGDQFGIGENTSHSLDNVSDGIVRDPYGKLGDFAKKIDQSSERYYLEDGFIRNIRPRSRSVFFQQPDIFVVFKKRMFSTLVDNSRLDLLEDKERILIAASKRLFQNKCRILSAYEKLTKIEQLTFESGRFNTYLAPSIFNLIDTLSDVPFLGISDKVKGVIEKLRRIVSYAEPGQFSNWTTNDYDAVFGRDIGEGPGTFELTNVSAITTNVSTEWGSGSASLTIEDPYNLLTITEADIDQALADVTNPMKGAFFKFTEIELQNRINELMSELAIARENRKASQITFKLSPGTVLSKRVRAIMDDEGVEIAFTYTTGIQDSLSGFEDADNAEEVYSSHNDIFSTGTVQIEPHFLSGNDSMGLMENNQLNKTEQHKFSEIIANTFTLLSQRQTSRNELKSRNIEINYARNRMRLFFSGKFIIQPMDTVSIWMTSRTEEDQRLPGGFQRQHNELGLGTAQKFDTIIKNVNNIIEKFKDPYSDKNLSYDDVERLSVVGPDMPKWLWRQFRQDITGQPTGPCIFSGIVGKGQQGVSGSFSDGKWTISVTCEDNTGYFDKSQVNFHPSADVFNSSIYDPLTPFDVSFDAATGVPLTEIGEGDTPPLLPENEKLIASGTLIFESGPEKGNSVNKQLYAAEAPNEISFDSFRKVLHLPNGLVYRWKQGIQSLTATGRSNPQTSTDQEQTVLLNEKPFGGQDVMNVLSLLITGIPYNYETFLKAAIANGNSLAANDPLTNTPAARTYIEGLLSDIERNNTIWGNFVPHKQLTVNAAVDKFIAEQRTDLTNKNEKLRQKLNERARLEDELILMQGGFSIDAQSAFGKDDQGRAVPRAPGSSFDVDGKSSALQTKISNLSDEIMRYQAEFDYTIKNQVSSDIGLTLIGNDVETNPTLTSLGDAQSNQSQKQRDELQLRRNLFKYTARRFWQVRANEDQNLFIVDDQYDKNLDIQAFSRKIGGKIEVFNSQYSGIGEQISSVKRLLGLECFANTQGHIQVRPPGYNKVPSSVFFKMFQDRDSKGTKVFPDFLESLYFNQIKGIFNQIEIIEDEIRLRAMALGAKDDNEIIWLILTGGSSGAVLLGSRFYFLTSMTGDGRIGTQSLNTMFFETRPEFMDDSRDQALKELGELQQNISTLTQESMLFPPTIQASAVANVDPNIAPDRQESIIEPIRTRLRIKTGREPKTINELFGNKKFKRLVNAEKSSSLDRLNLVNQIANYVSERQTLLRSVSNAIKNLKEGITINAPDVQNENIFQGGLGNVFKASSNNKASRALNTPFLNRRTEIPQFLDHMIEYEDEDDLGPNSGRRYVLTPDRILSITISENPPPFTMVTVKGLFGQGFVDADRVTGFATSQDGNAITSAYAVDYDMWYQYGFRVGKTIEAPFFSDPDSQCAPYAVSTLLEARENILQGSVEIAGYNEYHQPGDVVFIEDRGLLFYVKSVSHNFSYGKLSTKLELTYGHNPGEYIPTMLDTVGKILYNSKGFTGRFRNERFEMLGSARSIGALAFSQNLPSDNSLFGISGLSKGGKNTRFQENQEPIDVLLSGKYGERNRKLLNNTLFASSGALNQVSFTNQHARIKIVYYLCPGSYDADMYNLAFAVKDWLVNPDDRNVFRVNTQDIIIEEVDISDSNNQTRKRLYPEITEYEKNKQGPSSAAIAVVRALDVSDSSPAQWKILLANSVLDIFVDYEVIKNKTVSESTSVSQSAQEASAAIDAARGGRAQGS